MTIDYKQVRMVHRDCIKKRFSTHRPTVDRIQTCACLPGRNEPAPALAHTRSHESKGQRNNHRSHYTTAHKSKYEKVGWI